MLIYANAAGLATFSVGDYDLEHGKNRNPCKIALDE